MSFFESFMSLVILLHDFNMFFSAFLDVFLWGILYYYMIKCLCHLCDAFELLIFL